MAAHHGSGRVAALAAIERKAASLFAGFANAEREYRSACAGPPFAFDSIEAHNQRVLIEVASQKLRRLESELREFPRQVMSELPDVAKNLWHVTTTASFLDTDEKLAPVLNELRTIQQEAQERGVKAESDAAKPKRKPKPKDWWATEPPGDGWHGVPLIGEKQELARWVGVALRGEPVDETTLATMHTKSVWICRVHRTSWQAYFRDPKTLAAGNAEKLKSQTGTQAGAKRTKREPTGLPRKKSPRK